MKQHVKFKITDAKQLAIAFTGAFSTWAATGFQKDLPHLSYVIIGFISGGLVSHESSHFDQTIPPDAHIVTPYAQNMQEIPSTPAAVIPVTAVTTGTDVPKLIQISSGLVK
jgi:hypothetical protein